MEENKELTFRRDVIMCDLAAIPEDLTIEDVIFYGNMGYIFYDSSLKSDPNFKIIPKESKVLLFDICTEEGKKVYEEITKKLKENEPND